MSLAMIYNISFSMDVLLMYYFLLKSFKAKAKKEDLIYLVALMGINIGIRSIFGVNNFITYIILNTVSAIFYWKLIDKDFLNIAIHTLLAFVVLLLNEIIYASIVMIIFGVTMKSVFEVSIYLIMAIILSKTTFYYIARRWAYKMRFPKFYNSKSKKPIVLILFFNIFNIFMIFMIYKHMQGQHTQDLINLIALVIGALIFSIYIYRLTKAATHQDQKELMIKQKQEALSKTDFYVDSMNEILDTMQRNKHELNNHLSTIYGLIYLKKYEETKEYISKLNKDLRKFDTIIDRENPEITVLLSIKKNKAVQEDIEVNTEIDIPRLVSLDRIDISVLLGNLLENAIEACQKLEENEEKTINIAIYCQDNILHIKIDNSKRSDNKVDIKAILNRYTSKADSENHGFGLGNVEFVVNKYKGTIDIKDTRSRFIVDIELPMNG